MRGDGHELRTGAVTYLCVLANEDIGAKAAGTVADLGGEPVASEDDAYLASFDGAGRAVAAAVVLTRSAAVRIGIHTGDVAHARRLAAACDLGSALVSAVTAGLVDGDLPPGARLQPLGDRPLVGAAPERLFEVEHDPRAARQARERLLFNREQELGVLAAQLARARGGEGALVVVEGTAGIGKTRLLAEARGMAGEMRILGARAGEFESGFAFGVVRQLFEPLLATAPREVREDLLSGAAALAEPLFDATSVAEPEESDQAASFAVLHGLYWLAANVAFQQPTVFVIDDLHWADSPSLRWLGFLARRLEGLPLLVVAAMRPPEQGHEPELLTELLTDPAAEALRPGPLSVDSIEALAHRYYDAPPEPAFCQAVAEATRGNPLFAVALLDTVSRERVPPRADQSSRLLELGPRVIGRAVSLRLARLPADAISLLEAAAILGDGTDPREAAELAGLEPAVAARAARQLLRSDLLRSDSPLEFFHPVVRTAIYENLDAASRSARHREAALILVAAGATPERAAAHLTLTIPGDDASAVETLRAAAARSLASGAGDAAVRYLRRALAEQLDDRTHAAVLIELGGAETLTGSEDAVGHLRAGIALEIDPLRRAEASVELGRVLWRLDRWDESLDVLGSALEEVDAGRYGDLAERLDAELTVSAWLRAETYPIARDRLERFDPSTLNGGLGSELRLANVAFYELRLARDRHKAIEAARQALASGRLGQTGTASFHFGVYTLLGAGLFDEAIAAYDRALADAQRRGDLVQLSACLVFRGRCRTLRGEIDAALGDLREGFDMISEHGVHAMLGYATGLLALAQLERGDVDGAAETIAAPGFPEELPSRIVINFFQIARGRLRIETGEVERGVEDLLTVGRRCHEIPSDNPASYAWRRFAVDGLLLLGRNEEARRLAEEELEITRRWGARHEIGASLRALGRVVGGEEGERLLAEAVEMFAGTGARLQEARALLDLGAAQRRAGRRTVARERLRAAADLALRGGVLSLVERANEELAALGSRPRKTFRSGLDALTPSERRVAELAAGDLSNKEIAQALFVTVKTVELHLSSAYRKLALASRRELAAALAVST